MWENKNLLHRIILVVVLVIIFTIFCYNVSAKIVVSIGEDETVFVDEKVEFQGVGEGEYHWDFDESVDSDGDGNHTNDSQAKGKTVTHEFSETGTYIVTLTITQEGNVTQILQSQITVEEDTLVDPWFLGLLFVIIGIVMLLGEASSPGFFIGIPASILIVIGLFGIAFPDLFFSFWSPVIAAGTAGVVTFITILLYRRLAPPEAPTTTVGESLIGREGIVLVSTDPDSLTKGKVKIGSDTWSATSDKPIKAGTKVKVVASEGVHITVERIKK
jgi:membrane protein implicated in regulation of membrane protease activity